MKTTAFLWAVSETSGLIPAVFTSNMGATRAAKALMLFVNFLVSSGSIASTARSASRLVMDASIFTGGLPRNISVDQVGLRGMAL